MKTIYREQEVLDFKDFRLRLPAAADVPDVINEPFLLFDANGTLRIACLHLAESQPDRETLEALEWALPRIPMDNDKRAHTGLKFRGRSFGFMPRVTIRRDFCTASRLAISQPQEHKAFELAAPLVANYYRQLNPALATQHDAMTLEHVLPDYHLGGTMFTSGIINHNNQLHYHRDGGNYPDVWSGMLVFRNYVQGGLLVLPEFKLAIDFPDKSLFMFDGQGIIHGVTPMKLVTDRSYRYSVVFYSLRGMWNCLPLGQEIQRIRRLRSERERKRIVRDAGTL